MPIFPDMDLFEQRLIAALMALLISIVFGGWLVMLTRYGRLVGAIHQRVHRLFSKLNKQNRPAITRAMRGAVGLSIGLFVAFWVGVLLNDLLEPRAQPFWVLLHVMLLAVMLRASHAFLPIWYMGHAYETGRQSDMKGFLQSITLAPANAPDHHGQLRLGVMQSVEHLTHGVIGSVLAYLVGGFAGLLCYRMLHLLSVQTPKELVEWRAFGMIIHWVVQPILRVVGVFAALIMVMVSIVVADTKTWRGIGAVFRNRDIYISKLLDISLGGSLTHYGLTMSMDFVGSGTAQLKQPQARAMASLALMVLSVLVLSLVLGLSMIQ